MIRSDERFINILSYKDEAILNRNRPNIAYTGFYSFEDWVYDELGLKKKYELMEIPKAKI